MVKDNLKTSVNYLVVIILLRNCDVTFEACLNAIEVYPPCTSYPCSRSCNDLYCQQTCDIGECILECNEVCCQQYCSGTICTLRCHTGACYQICSGAECILECDPASQKCDQSCSGGHCIRTSIFHNDTYTMEPTIEASTKALPHFNSCQTTCPATSSSKRSSKTTITTYLPTASLIAQSSTSSSLSSLTNRTTAKPPPQPPKTKTTTTSLAPPPATTATTIITTTNTTTAKPPPQPPPSLTTTTSLAPPTTTITTTTTTETTTMTTSFAPAPPTITKTIETTTASTTTTTLHAPTPSQTIRKTTSTKTSTITALLTPTTKISTTTSSATASKPNGSKSENISKTEELVISFLSTLNRTDVRQDSSLQDAVDLLQNTTQQLKNVSFDELQLHLITEKDQKSFVFKMAFAFEDFALKYGQYHLDESNSLLGKNFNILVLRLERVLNQNASDFRLQGPEKQNFVNIPSSNFQNNDLVLLGIVYKDLHELLASSPTKNRGNLDSMLMAATMDTKPKKLQQNVALNFRNLKTADEKRFCVFWSGYSKQTPDGWSEKGCHVVESKSNLEETECSCNHMTHFAVLFDHGDNPEITKTDQKILKILTYVGLALSITGIILTVICYVSFTDVHQPLSQIRVSLAGSLGAGQIIFLAGISATGNTIACVTVAALMQYFLMAAFCWMLVEGIYLYLLVVKVYNINDKMTIYHFVSWGLPAVMVAISLGIAAAKDGIQSFVSNEYCWMSSTNNLIWIFVAFVAVVEFVNMLLLVRVIKEMTTMQFTADDHFQQIRLGIKTCVVMVPLLGVTWLFGLLTPLHIAFVYIFTILNSVQGFLIFVLHCVRNNQIKYRFKRRIYAVFPAANDRKILKRTSQINKSDFSRANSKAMEVQSCGNSAFELY